jgi:hypothetical protein
MKATKTLPKAMTSDELRDALARANFGQTEFARLYGKNGSTVRGYLCGAHSIPPAVALLARILAAHPELKAEAIALAGLSPEDIKPPVGGAARKKRQQEEQATPDATSAPVPLAERWSEDDGAGVRVTLPDGKEIVLGAEKSEPEPAAEGPARTLPAPNQDDVAKRMAAFRKSLKPQGKRRK